MVNASLAQWKSTSLVNWGPWVQTPQEAMNFFFSYLYHVSQVKIFDAVGRVRTYAGRAHWISSPTP